MRIVDLCAEYNRAVSNGPMHNSLARANELQVKGHKSRVIGRSIGNPCEDETRVGCHRDRRRGCPAALSSLDRLSKTVLYCHSPRRSK